MTYEDWLAELFDGNEDEVVVNLHNKELKKLYEEELYTEQRELYPK